MELKGKERWRALLRGNLVNTTTNKLINYVSIADRRAQNILIINTFLIPIALSMLQKDEYVVPIIIVIITSVCSILCAIICLSRKRYTKSLHHGSDLFHFTSIAQHSEEEYTLLLNEALEDRESTFRLVASDLYHISKFVLVPKFAWLNRSYLIFMLGNTFALSLFFVEYFFKLNLKECLTLFSYL